MTITHNSTLSDTRVILQSEYDPMVNHTRPDGTKYHTGHSLTRILNSHIHTIHLKPDQTQITDLHRFTSLANDLFIDLAELQQRRRQRA